MGAAVIKFSQEVCTAYSTPIPDGWRQVSLLVLTCAMISGLAGILLYLWLFHSLRYEHLPASASSAAFAFTTCAILAVVHPIRCVLTMVIPTLGTKQGSRILLSTSFMIIALNILPNILKNLKAVFQIFRCIAQHTAEKALNSTDDFRSLAGDVHRLVTETNDVVAALAVTSAAKIDIFTQINTSKISHPIRQAVTALKTDFEAAESLFKDILLVANRVMAGLFIIYILFNATWYLRNYLTDISFDNRYVTSQLEEKAEKMKVTNISSVKLIRSAGFKMSRKELVASLIRCLLILMFFLLTLMIIAVDHMVFRFAVAVSRWASDLPAAQVNFQLRYTAEVSLVKIIKSNVVSYSRDHQVDLTFFSESCKSPTSPPEISTTVVICFIYCVIFVVRFLETYAQRLCRKISSLFYRKRETERVTYLFLQIQKMLRDQGGSAV
ncbi:osteoclast stimulatory transmembrane protein [Gastrophryne carolinensis]